MGHSENIPKIFSAGCSNNWKKTFSKTFFQEYAFREILICPVAIEPFTNIESKKLYQFPMGTKTDCCNKTISIFV